MQGGTHFGPFGSNSSPIRFGISVLFLIALLALALGSMGRPAICGCWEVKIWLGQIFSPQMSQQLSDWYSFTHIEHGVLFYFFGWLFFPHLGINERFLMALAIEVGWEILENTPWFVQFYRSQALATGYTGDSILNSISDVGFMAIGYFIAATAPIWASIGSIAFIELFLAYWIRDNLTLNFLNFIYPFEFIARWQSGTR